MRLLNYTIQCLLVITRIRRRTDFYLCCIFSGVARKMRHYLLHCLILILIASNEALRILVCFPVPSKSHSILGHGLVDRLLEAGHEVVHMTSFPRNNLKPNLKEIDVSSIGKKFIEDSQKKGSFQVKNLITQSFGETWNFPIFTYNTHKNFVEHSSVVKLFSDVNEKFDAVVLEWFYSEINAGIPPLFNAPTIWFCSTEPNWQALRIIDDIPNMAFTVDLYSTYTIPLSFWQRADLLWKVIKEYTIQELLIAPLEAWTYNSVYPEIATKRGVPMPSYSEAVYNGSLMFVNSHPTIGSSKQLPPNVVYIGGYHINNEVEVLPQDLQILMDNAQNGVIYFSLGSNVKSGGMSDKMKQSLLKMFSKFDQTIIWKFEGDLPNVPPNVHLREWVPQPSILKHPNLKLFITHGGQLSTTEAIHFGVPIVGIPVMADQGNNMITAEKKGFGVKVNLAEDMADDLEAAIKKVLLDDSYSTKAKEVSSMFHNQPLKPGAAVPYWVEYVVQTHGAQHLRSPAIQVPMYQRLHLDIISFLLLVLYLVTRIVKFLLNKLTGRAGKTKTKQN